MRHGWAMDRGGGGGHGALLMAHVWAGDGEHLATWCVSRHAGPHQVTEQLGRMRRTGVHLDLLGMMRRVLQPYKGATAVVGGS